jgi:hypothetical protein
VSITDEDKSSLIEQKVLFELSWSKVPLILSPRQRCSTLHHICTLAHNILCLCAQHQWSLQSHTCAEVLERSQKLSVIRYHLSQLRRCFPMLRPASLRDLLLQPSQRAPHHVQPQAALPNLTGRRAGCDSRRCVARFTAPVPDAIPPSRCIQLYATNRLLETR